MKQSLIILLLLLSYFENSYSQRIIEMEKTNGIYQIPCKVNGIPMKLIFDTGASNVSISITEAKFLIKQGLIRKDDFLENVSFQMADGDIVEGTKFIIKTIEIGGKKLNNIEATIMHQQNAPLLLGQSAISKLGNYTISGNKLIINDNSETVTENTIDDAIGYKSLKFDSPIKQFDNLKFIKEYYPYDIYQLSQFDNNLETIADIKFDLILLAFNKNEDKLKRISLNKIYSNASSENFEDLRRIVSIFESIFGKSKYEEDKEKYVIRHFWVGDKNSLSVTLKLDDIKLDKSGLPQHQFSLEVRFTKI